jgi:D-alanyl-D-alanine dipeptidase
MYYFLPLKRKNKKRKKMFRPFHFIASLQYIQWHEGTKARKQPPLVPPKEGKGAKMIVVFSLLLFVFACNNPPVQQQIVDVSIPESESLPIVETEEKSPVVLLLDSLGFIDIQKLEPSILVDLKYATDDNFTGKAIYSDLHQAYLHPVATAKLVKAQQMLQEQHPGFSLLVYDAARPLSIQRLLWESVKDTPLSRYVANPETTGLHNYGMAVDLTIADTLQIPLDMGTPFDYFGAKAGINHEDYFLTMGLLTQEQIGNRRLLRSIMRQSGFYAIEGEWWHFNACSLSEAKNRYLLIE